jgi:tRNA pseudouridine38-40 synthase
MRNLRIDLEYDGTEFAGWAKQPGLATIEGSLEEVLGRILQEQVRFSVAGRTDAGVHARGQVASLTTEAVIAPGKLRSSANKLLPAGIVITEISEAPKGFDARGSAFSRTYSYGVLDRAYPSSFRHRYVHYFPGALDEGLLLDAAGMIVGDHDFTAFTPTQTEHVHFRREVTLSRWRREGDLLVYHIRASSFLRNMVRVLVGTMLDVGRGFRPLSDLEALLSGAARDAAGKTAPARGLCLEKVEYQHSSHGGCISTGRPQFE